MMTTAKLLLILFVWYLSIDDAISSPTCPKVCDATCQLGSLNCQNGGLIRLPEKLFSGTTKIILIDHRFDDSTLRAANLSHYGTPNFKIVSMFLRNCSVRSIEERAFATLTSLQRLDLSKNRLTDIVSDTFSGLDLQQLRLDYNRNLRLNKFSFRGLIVRSLSLSNCNLKVLSHASFVPIAGHLNKLILAQNQLVKVDPVFDSLFHNLESVDLSANPFHCSCDMRWLAKVFTWKVKYGRMSKSFDQYDLYPKCVSPPSLADISLHKVPDSMFFCDPPRLRAVEVDFASATAGRLTCTAQGSPDMLVRWDYLSLSDRYVHPPYRGDPNSAVMLISKRKEREHYACQVVDKTGNVTANVRITWPPTTALGATALPLVPQPKRPPFSVGLDRNRDDESQIYEQKPKDDRDEQGSFSRPPPSRPGRPNSDTFLFKKQFTLLEMIGAVVGTFTVTLAIFLLVYRCLQRSKKPERTRPSYSHYEPAAYSDSQTYDIPQHSTYLPPLPPPPPPNGSFLDFKTQRKLYN